MERGLVVRTGRGDYELTEPLFGEYVRRRASDD
jgi:hypothetical protein